MNILSAFPAVYELIRGEALPARESYGLRDVPETITVSKASSSCNTATLKWRTKPTVIFVTSKSANSHVILLQWG